MSSRARLAALLLLAASPCAARESSWGPYDAAKFLAAQKAGHVVLVQFTSAGCGVCVQQERILAPMFWSSTKEDLLGFQVDVEKSKALAESFAVDGRSTLILFKGSRELGRSVGLASETDIRKFIDKAYEKEPRGRPKSRPRNRTNPSP